MADNDGNDDGPAERTEVVTYEETRRRAQAAASSSMASSAPRQLGRYRLDGVIAQGGMAEVWLATIEGPGRFTKKVVVKRIRPSLVRQAHAQAGKHAEMFVREAQLLSRLEHRHIVAVLELGVEPAARAGEPDEHYIVMERLEGLTLRDVALRSWHAGRPLPVELVVGCVADACLGLDHAHNLKDDRGQPANLVHRDVSPDNLFLTRAGVTKLLDFGIAKREDMAALTTTGELKGKVPYMAPEQLTGVRLDARADVYAVGVVLYWLLCGRRPFDGPSDVFTMKAILDDPPRPLRDLNPEVPTPLADVVMGCLEKDPARRPGSAAVLHDRLSALLQGLAGAPPDPIAFLAAVEALPPAAYETAPDVAATCAQRWPGPLPAAVATSLPPSTGDARDVEHATTVQVPLDHVRLPALRVAPVESRRLPVRSAGVAVDATPPATLPAAAPTDAPLDFDDAPTLPPGGDDDSTADGPSMGSTEAGARTSSADAARPLVAVAAASPVPTSRASSAARLAEEPTIVRRAPQPPTSSSPSSPPPSSPPPSSPPPSSPPAVSIAPPGSWLDDESETLNDTVALNLADPRLQLQPALPDPREEPAFAAPLFPSPAALVAAAEMSRTAPPDDATAALPPPWRSRIVVVTALAVVVVLADFAAWSLRVPPRPMDARTTTAEGTDAKAGSRLDDGIATAPAGVPAAATAGAVDAVGTLDAGAVVVTAVEQGDGDQRPRQPSTDPPAAGAVLVRARPGTRVFVDGRFVGVTPLQALPVSVGRHTVRLGFRGVRSKHEIDVVAGRTAFVRDGRGGTR